MFFSIRGKSALVIYLAANVVMAKGPQLRHVREELAQIAYAMPDLNEPYVTYTDFL